MMAGMLVLGGLPLVAGGTAYLAARAVWWMGIAGTLIVATCLFVLTPILGPFAGVSVPVIAALLFGMLCSLIGRLVSTRPHMIASAVFLLSFALVAAIWGASHTGGL
ncbi:hypothetical protein [uncultured Tateyamaria sp.]|uniref:hypothetical protein n=1 Tax=uncultured Tateyamaria sp. TaxID=455651 RepID=UPI0026339CF2|nr:hypothetical protein [uncultured Tateyamaria sp.]